LPEHDAFGRPVGEDPLGGLGWTSPRPADPPPPPRRRGGRGIAAAGVVVAAALGGVALVAVGREDPAARVQLPAVRTAAPEAVGAAPLTRPDAFRAGLRILERDVPGRLQTLRVEDARIDVTVGISGGRLRIAQLKAGAEAAQVFTTTGGGFPRDGLVPYEAVRADAPDRLIRGANRRLGKQRSDVNYLVLLRMGDEPGWSLFYKDGTHVRGDRRGRYQG
jgi:hypothetical protein